MLWFKILSPAACYFLFNLQFFRFAESVLGSKPLRKRGVMLTFLLNYSIFFLCVMFRFHLIFNWIVFLFLLNWEQMVLYKQPVRKCFLLSLLGTQLGLAANILFRSLFAVVLDLPLAAFDSRVVDPSDMKAYPILLGFLIVGAIFWIIARSNCLKGLALVMEDKATMTFFLGLSVAMHFYLCMNLLVYSIQKDNIILKLWSMKSSAFVVFGECLSIILSIQMGQLAVYRTKNRQARELLAKEQLRELELRVIASTDPLTGCENRLQAGKRLQDMLDTQKIFCLCFVDLNGLKFVNDNFGHEMGDNYLLAVTKALKETCGGNDFLFRYGGDEFLMLFFESTDADAAQRLIQAQQRLEDERSRKNYPFYMSISYGFATPDDAASASELIQIADARMYQMKASKQKQ